MLCLEVSKAKGLSKPNWPVNHFVSVAARKREQCLQLKVHSTFSHGNKCPFWKPSRSLVLQEETLMTSALVSTSWLFLNQRPYHSKNLLLSWKHFPFHTENCWLGFRCVLNVGNAFRSCLNFFAVYALNINTSKYYICDHCPLMWFQWLIHTVGQFLSQFVGKEPRVL